MKVFCKSLSARTADLLSPTLIAGNVLGIGRTVGSVRRGGNFVVQEDDVVTAGVSTQGPKHVRGLILCLEQRKFSNYTRSPCKIRLFGMRPASGGPEKDRQHATLFGCRHPLYTTV